MKARNKKYRCAAGLFALLLLCGCSRVQVPMEELQAADKPVEGVTESQKPDETPPHQPDAPAEAPKPILEEGLCVLLPGTEGSYTLFDRNGQKQGVIPGGDADLTGVYSIGEIVAGHRLSDGSAVLPQVSATAEWVRDADGFSVYDRQAGLLYRLDSAGTLLFFCSAPDAAEHVALLPFGRDFLVSIWSGSGTDTDPWRQMVPCVLLNQSGQVERDLSGWISAPVRGVLGSELLLLACPDSEYTDAYDLEGNCQGQGLYPLAAAGSQALGGVLCEYVWRDGWICSAGLQPQTAYPDLQALQLCGDHISGVVYDIGGVSSNGQLLVCGQEAAVWGVDQGLLAIQWQGINYHFDAGDWKYQQLQRCSRTLAVSYAWDDSGRAAFRLLFLASGAVLEYDCPAGAKASALLGDDYALFATAQADPATGQQSYRFWVVDASGVLRQESASPLMPCAIGPYLLRREEAGVSLLDLDGKALLSAPAA